MPVSVCSHNLSLVLVRHHHTPWITLPPYLPSYDNSNADQPPLCTLCCVLRTLLLPTIRGTVEPMESHHWHWHPGNADHASMHEIIKPEQKPGSFFDVCMPCKSRFRLIFGFLPFPFCAFRALSCEALVTLSRQQALHQGSVQGTMCPAGGHVLCHAALLVICASFITRRIREYGRSSTSCSRRPIWAPG